MIIGASGGSAPEWLDASSAPPDGGHVLDPLDLDPEPVAVVEVEDRLHQLVDALRAAPVVHLALGSGGGISPVRSRSGGGSRRRAPPAPAAGRRRRPRRSAVRARTASSSPASAGSCPPSSGLSALRRRRRSPVWLCGPPRRRGHSCRVAVCASERRRRATFAVAGRRPPPRRRAPPRGAGSPARSGRVRARRAAEVTRPTSLPAAVTVVPGSTGVGEEQHAQVAVRDGPCGTCGRPAPGRRSSPS